MAFFDDTVETSRRRFLGALAVASASAGLTVPIRVLAGPISIKVWKSPTCGCCVDWVEHLEANGFEVSIYDDGNSDARKRLGMPVRYGSCHTASVNGYAIEGHVPAKDIHRLLEERPDAIGLSVPAMPRGSPGMDGPIYGNVVDPYDVLLVASDGSATVYASYR